MGVPVLGWLCRWVLIWAGFMMLGKTKCLYTGATGQEEGVKMPNVGKNIFKSCILTTSCYLPARPSKFLFLFDFKNCIMRKIGLCCGPKLIKLSLSKTLDFKKISSSGTGENLLLLFSPIQLYIWWEEVGRSLGILYTETSQLDGWTFWSQPQCFLSRLMFRVLPGHVLWRPNCNLARRWCGLGQHSRSVSAVHFER